MSRAELLGRVLECGRGIVRGFLERVSQTRMVVDRFGPEEMRRSYLLLSQPIVQEADRLRDDLIEAFRDRIRSVRHRQELLHHELLACSPYGVLKRGYAVVRNADGGILTAVDGVSAGDDIDVRLYKGSLGATVKEISKE